MPLPWNAISLWRAPPGDILTLESNRNSMSPTNKSEIREKPDQVRRAKEHQAPVLLKRKRGFFDVQADPSSSQSKFGE